MQDTVLHKLGIKRREGHKNLCLSLLLVPSLCNTVLQRCKKQMDKLTATNQGMPRKGRDDSNRENEGMFSYTSHPQFALLSSPIYY